MRRALAIAAGVAAVALVLSGTAGATIVVGKSIDGVVLGMSQAAVRASAGRPRQVLHRTNDFGPYTEFRYPGYVVDFQGNAKVTAVVTTLARERTPGGAGVGSTWDEVKAKVPRVQCEGAPSIGNCHVGQFLPGRTVTDFFFRRGVVSKVVVGIVLD